MSGIDKSGIGPYAPPQSSTSADIEEIPSDSEDGDRPDANQEGEGVGDTIKTRLQRKRTRDWVRMREWVRRREWCKRENALRTRVWGENEGMGVNK